MSSTSPGSSHRVPGSWLKKLVPDRVKVFANTGKAKNNPKPVGNATSTPHKIAQPVADASSLAKGSIGSVDAVNEQSKPSSPAPPTCCSRPLEVGSVSPTTTTSEKSKMKAFFTKIKYQRKHTGSVLMTAGTIVRDAADAFPPLKSLAGGAVSVAEHVKRTTDLKLDVNRTLTRVNEVGGVLDSCDVLSPASLRSAEAVKDLCSSDIQATVGPLADASSVSCFLHLPEYENAIKTANRRLDEALQSHLVVSSTDTQRSTRAIEERLIYLDTRLSQLHVITERSSSTSQQLLTTLDTLPERIERVLAQTRPTRAPPHITVWDAFERIKKPSVPMITVASIAVSGIFF